VRVKICRLAGLLPLLLGAACAAPPERPLPRDPEPARARAALATLHVVNATAERLSIGYRIAARGPAEVGIGQVLPRDSATMAPVPAAEPIVLVARTAAGLLLSMPARTMGLDGEWTWRIPADAHFTPPPRAGLEP
jgi:hypothetical protein